MPPRPGELGPPDGVPPHPTLVVFTLGAVAEARSKRLLPEALRDREARLFRACLDEALSAGRACGFRLQVSAPRRADLGSEADPIRRAQTDGPFGERLAVAFDAAGPAPDAPVMVVGTDTPGLSADRLRRAHELLAAGDSSEDRAVIGPSPDGGLYLLAATRPLGEILRRVPWRRRRTLSALRRELERAGLTVLLLDPLGDLDRPADLDGWLAGRAFATDAVRRIAAVLARLLATLRLPLALPDRPAPLPAVVPARTGRAPPHRRIR